MKKIGVPALLFMLFSFSACRSADDDWPAGPTEPAQTAYYAGKGYTVVIYEDYLSLFWNNETNFNGIYVDFIT